MKKLVVVMFFGMALAFLPVANPVFSPDTAHAAQMRSADSDMGNVLLDLFIVRPFHYIVLAGALISYPMPGCSTPSSGTIRTA